MTMNYSEYFQVGDVVSFDHADSPDWVKGYWRVSYVGPSSARVRPLKADKTLDAERDTGWSYLVQNGGIVRSALVES